MEWNYLNSHGRSSMTIHVRVPARPRVALGMFQDNRQNTLMSCSRNRAMKASAGPADDRGASAALAMEAGRSPNLPRM
eukprot:3102300-Pyramimonas_sp.AAC.1